MNRPGIVAAGTAWSREVKLRQGHQGPRRNSPAPSRRSPQPAVPPLALVLLWTVLSGSIRARPALQVYVQGHLNPSDTGL